MTLSEFSDGFDTLVGSYRRFKDFDRLEILDSIEFDEYEKSLYLTKAQKEIVISLYDGKNHFGDSFESTEEIRRDLDRLVRTAYYNISDAVRYAGIENYSKVFKVPEDMMFIIYEQIRLADESLKCFDGEVISVYPIKHDEYRKVRNNPFRGTTKYKALRLDIGDPINLAMVEIISKYTFSEYIMRYVKRPTPIILETLPNELTIEGINEATECELNPILHHKILERAVLMALRAKGINTDK